MHDGVRVKMHVRVVCTDTREVILPTEEYECQVDPVPHFYHRKAVLLIQAEAMAKIKYVNHIFSRIANEADIRNRFHGKAWDIDAVIVARNCIPEPELAA